MKILKYNNEGKRKEVCSVVERTWGSKGNTLLSAWTETQGCCKGWMQHNFLRLRIVHWFSGPLLAEAQGYKKSNWWPAENRATGPANRGKETPEEHPPWRILNGQIKKTAVPNWNWKIWVWGTYSMQWTRSEKNTMFSFLYLWSNEWSALIIDKVLCTLVSKLISGFGCLVQILPLS